MTERFTGTGGLALPPVTRMLLRADGSTTLLLEAILDEPLSLDLVDQRTAGADELSSGVRSVLGCAPGDKVIRRRSILRTADGIAVSHNDVTVVSRDQELTGILTHGRIPIGHGLAAAGRRLGRTVLATGWTIWPLTESNGARCVYKEYILLDQESTVVAHIRERFNPMHVPDRIRG
ncbi:hypothetical protein AB0B25_27905 [Nocardia sp. NPDC049190]|uniref:chorismate--pyruvate lyase family protein n=1 Tax=Nocardia sp. NPDC049190 TaxID=3155650 RepID=UPI0033D17E43